MRGLSSATSNERTLAVASNTDVFTAIIANVYKQKIEDYSFFFSPFNYFKQHLSRKDVRSTLKIIAINFFFFGSVVYRDFPTRDLTSILIHQLLLSHKLSFGVIDSVVLNSSEKHGIT